MKFKILNIKQRGDVIHVSVSHEFSERDSFALSADLLEDGEFINKIRKILNKRYSKPQLNKEELSKYDGKEY